MRRRFTPVGKRSRAFTLIELLVVIVVLGILMAVALPTFLSQQTKAQDSRTQQYLTTAFKAIRASTPDTSDQYPSSTSMVSWIEQSEPELTAQRGDCLSGVTSAPVDAVLVDPSSTANSLQLCARSQSGNVWKLVASANGPQQILDGTLVPLTMSGNEITDATRAADVQGDGLSNDSSTGIWEGTANLVPNGGFETSASSWGMPAGVTLARSTAKSKFGVASGKVATPSTGGSVWVPRTDVSVSGGSVYALSLWAAGEVGGEQISIQVDWYDSSGSYISSSATSVATLSTSFSRVVLTTTSPATAAQAAPVISINGALAATFYIDGVQFEQKPLATPYVETNGATATRNAARVQAPAVLLNATQGWVAMRVRYGWDATTQTNAPRIFAWADDGNNLIQLRFEPSDRGWYMQRQASGVGLSANTPAATHMAGDTGTLIAAWDASYVYVSLNGSAFVKAANTDVPALTATQFDIGTYQGVSSWLDSSVLWFACGTGILSNADAATINSWGNSDPSRSQFPAAAQATMVWNGVGPYGSLK